MHCKRSFDHANAHLLWKCRRCSMCSQPKWGRCWAIWRPQAWSANRAHSCPLGWPHGGRRACRWHHRHQSRHWRLGVQIRDPRAQQDGSECVPGNSLIRNHTIAWLCHYGMWRNLGLHDIVAGCGFCEYRKREAEHLHSAEEPNQDWWQGKTRSSGSW